MLWILQNASINGANFQNSLEIRLCLMIVFFLTNFRLKSYTSQFLISFFHEIANSTIFEELWRRDWFSKQLELWTEIFNESFKFILCEQMIYVNFCQVCSTCAAFLFWYNMPCIEMPPLVSSDFERDSAITIDCFPQKMNFFAELPTVFYNSLTISHCYSINFFIF